MRLSPLAGGPAPLRPSARRSSPPEPPTLAGSESRLVLAAGGAAPRRPSARRSSPPEPPALAGSESQLAWLWSDSAGRNCGGMQ